jgi:copper chaperone CopZ
METQIMTTGTTTHTYSITGMSCMSCVQKVSAALQKVEGIAAAVVSLNPPQARLEMKDDVSPSVLKAAIARVGAYQIAESEPHRHVMAETAEEPAENLYPLFLIVGYIAGATGLVSVLTGNFAASFLMDNFMAGFFLVFSFFKLLDLRGFVDAYRSYDLLARALPGWSFVYPFIELALGIAYLLRINPIATNAITLAIMLIGAVGVLKALLDKRAIRCACLGTALKLPMTKVTLVEDLGMAAMAAVMLTIFVHH